MSRKRKTIPVVALVQKVNNFNTLSCSSVESREAVNSFLEGILHETGNYQGFNYYTKGAVPWGEKPGIIYGDPNTFPDQTRRFYYHS